jgi:hypothetical protein
MSRMRIGTCNWKYPSWTGLVYSAGKGIDYLTEHAARCDTVEVDQWFWAPFPGSQPRLPDPSDVHEYRRSAPRSAAGPRDDQTRARQASSASPTISDVGSSRHRIEWYVVIPTCPSSSAKPATGPPRQSGDLSPVMAISGASSGRTRNTSGKRLAGVRPWHKPAAEASRLLKMTPTGMRTDRP